MPLRPAESTPRYSSRTVIVLFSLLSIMAALAVISGLDAPPDKEYQIRRALGCRNSASVLILRIDAEEKVHWPDGGICSLEEAQLLLPSWSATHDEPVLAVLAERETRLARIQPLLATAQENGMHRAIFAVFDDSGIRILSSSRSAG